MYKYYVIVLYNFETIFKVVYFIILHPVIAPLLKLYKTNTQLLITLHMINFKTRQASCWSCEYSPDRQASGYIHSYRASASLGTITHHMQLLGVVYLHIIIRSYTIVTMRGQSPIVYDS